MVEKQWLTVTEVSKILQLSEVTIRRFCAMRLIDPKCGKKMGRQWRFKRNVIVDDGLLLRSE
jgi:hypothetical protein